MWTPHTIQYICLRPSFISSLGIKGENEPSQRDCDSELGTTLSPGKASVVSSIKARPKVARDTNSTPYCNPESRSNLRRLQKHYCSSIGYQLSNIKKAISTIIKDVALRLLLKIALRNQHQ